VKRVFRSSVNIGRIETNKFIQPRLTIIKLLAGVFLVFV
jgi:hypothetical protein